jgi:hypothetical protein
MRKRLSSLVLLVAGIAGCTSATTTIAGLSDSGAAAGAKVEVVAEGGIAALSITHRISHDDRAFVYVQRHLCGTSCAAPMDSASGTVSAVTVDSLFNGVIAQKILFNDDYGTTSGAADMMEYTVRITSGGTVKTIRADDGTMPGALRQIVDAVRATISAARK